MKHLLLILILLGLTSIARSESFYIKCFDKRHNDEVAIEIDYENNYVFYDYYRGFNIIEISELFITGLSDDNSMYRASKIVINRLEGKGHVNSTDGKSIEIHKFEDCKKVEVEF